MDPNDYKPHRNNYAPLRDQDQTSAREALEQHIQQSTEAGRSAAQEPNRPEFDARQLAAEREGYAHGSMESQQRAALGTNARLNHEYFEHQHRASNQAPARAELDEHIQKANRGELAPPEQPNVDRKTEIENER